MIILTFRAKASSENCNELLQSLTSMLARVRGQNGCLGCYSYRSIEDSCDFSFVEQWAGKEHLNAHMRSDLYSVIQGAFRVLTEGHRIDLVGVEDISQWLV